MNKKKNKKILWEHFKAAACVEASVFIIMKVHE